MVNKMGKGCVIVHSRYIRNKPRILQNSIPRVARPRLLAAEASFRNLEIEFM